MRSAALTAVIVLASTWAALPVAAAEGDAGEAAPPPAEPLSPRPRAEAPLPRNLPPDAAAALVRAGAAYEYGDLNQVVEAARFITEGSLPATQEQQAQAFRLLGIGLFLTNRPLGAEAAFTELLRKDPHARLDPTTTRPELVAFFESLRHQQLARERSTRKVAWNFIPPAGQFQNGDNVKGWVILSLGLVSGATCLTSYVLYRSWQRSDGTAAHEDLARTFRSTVNPISGAIVAAVYLYGVFDGLIGYSKPLDDSRAPVSLQLFPGGGGLGFTF